MKKLLLMCFFLPMTAFAESNIYVLDSHTDNIKILCINDYVFVTTKDGGVVQMMTGRDRGKGGVGLLPVSCEGYKKKKEKIIDKSNG